MADIRDCIVISEKGSAPKPQASGEAALCGNLQARASEPTQPTQPTQKGSQRPSWCSTFFFPPTFSSLPTFFFLFFPFFFFYILFSSFYSSRPLVYTLGALLAPHLRRRLAVAGILLQRDQLLRPEPLIVHHRRGLDQILKMGPRQKIA